MKVRPKEVKATVTLLTDPNPTFMSIVDHGAAQVPFASVKSHVPRKGSTAMANRLKKGKGATAQPMLTQLTFSKARFPSKKQVTDYIAENEIAGAGKVEDGDDVWIVKSTEDTSKLKLSKALATPGKETGVTAFIAKVLGVKDDEDEEEDDDTVSKGGNPDDEDDDDTEDGEEEEASKSDDDDGEEDEDAEPAAKSTKKGQGSKVKSVEKTPAKKTIKRKAPAKKSDDDSADDIALELPPELAAKYDWWGSYCSGETDLMAVIGDGMSYDNLPPGVDEIFYSAKFTAGNILGSDEDGETKKSKLEKMGTDLSRVIMGLFTVFDQATEDAQKSADAEIRKSAKRFVESFSTSVTDARKGTSPAAKGKKKPYDKDDKDKADKSAANVSNDDEDGEVELSDEGEAILSAIEKRFSSFDKALNAVTKKVSEISSESRRSTTRKSMTESLDELVDPKTVAKAEREASLKDQATKNLAGILGMRR